MDNTTINSRDAQASQLSRWVTRVTNSSNNMYQQNPDIASDIADITDIAPGITAGIAAGNTVDVQFTSGFSLQ